MNDLLNPPITSFSGDNSFLSNFAPCEIVTPYEVGPSKHMAVDVIRFKLPTTEHSYQLQKFEFYSIPFERILRAKTAGEAKRIANDSKDLVLVGFHKNKVKIMAELLNQKFKTDNYYGKRLLATGDAVLIEGNRWGDTFWGAVDGVGKNVLGTLLMLKRDELRTKFISEEYLNKFDRCHHLSNDPLYGLRQTQCMTKEILKTLRDETI